VVAAEDASGNAGSTVVVPVTIVSDGSENSISGTLTFDPTILTFSSAVIGGDDPYASVTTNSFGASAGSVGVTITLPPTETLPAGNRTVLLVEFAVASDATSGTTPIGWSSMPTAERVLDANMSILPAAFAGGTVTILPPSVLYVFPAGLSMISSPVDDTGFTLSEDFSPDNVTLAVWNPSAMPPGYVVSPTAPADTLRAGQGYWARFGAATDLLNVGSPIDPSSPVSILLAAGWNMVGVPRVTAVTASQLSLQSDGTLYPIGRAVAAGIIGNTFYTYQVGDTQYEAVSAISASLKPYEAYWVYAYEPSTLVFGAL
jgi:hypothetical protein